MWRYLSCYLLIALPVYAQDITGDLNTNIGDDANVDSNNSSSTTNNNYNATGAAQAAPVMSAISPTITGGGGNDSCLIPKTQGIQLSIMGASSGGMEQDPKCNRRKDARLMGTPQQVGGLGLQVSGISIMCSDAVVFKAMLLANTPCPVMDVDSGALAMGRDAIKLYRRQPEIFVIGYSQDRAFYDAVLKIGQELEDVQETTVTKYEPLSVQFRGSRRRGTGQDYQLDKQPDGD